ncbi:histidine--tRNA ligase [Rudanella paleaurantiibacter]|uniref:Histidine--tRNA ligase n=1 Tax=Rudanella paleaurantiibacter TaxID=2614655 RepID=A0A7J5U4M2_9BACT|nr:histidine--tRNA ligase [Rudanella paleaurantiibacter]KAB7732788.1 histidine--tRNA ligase [Rudanella paleaurantiibacter]
MKPSLVKGTRDFGPEQMSKRLFIFDTIRATFKRFGFLPLETPAMENLSTLTGKYGDEGDQLLFKILNSGDFAASIAPEVLATGSKAVLPKIAEKGLRYDLTVPFARYVVMNRHALALPFKRYQMQPVWRADRPQKGRYREFYQCDADVVGTDSLLCEAEIVLMVHEVMRNLGIQNFALKVNNRKILTGIAEAIGAPGMEGALAVAIDKLDKIGQEKVLDELRDRGFAESAITALLPMFTMQGTTEEVLNKLKSWLTQSETAQKGIAELEETLRLVAQYGLENPQIELDVTLARGLSYYTGAIFEVKALGVSIGSISGGGRYDNLTSAFGTSERLSGVGISFGVDRIYDVMEELSLFPADAGQGTTVLLVPFDAEGRSVALPLLNALRRAGVSAEMYPDLAKVKKMLDYANAKRIPYVVLIGSEEVQTGQLAVKNMLTGEQQKMTAEAVISFVQG